MTPLHELMRVYSKILGSEPTDDLRFQSRDLCKQLLEQSDEYNLRMDDAMVFTIRKMIVKLQSHVGDQ